MSSTVTASARQYTAANSEYFSIASNASLQTGDIDFTWAGWVYMDSLGTFRTLFPCKFGSSGAFEYILEYDTTPTAGFAWYVSPNGSSPLTSVVDTTSISINTWYFIVCWHDSVNNVIKICVNDGSVFSTAHTTGVYAGTAAFTPSNNANTYYQNGRMANWGFWKRVLTSAEITALYNAGAGKLYKDLTTGEKTSLISWWDGAETSGSARDAHGTNHLTDNNTVTSAAGKVTYTAEDASQFTAANSEYLSNANLSFGDTNYSFCGWTYLTDKSGVRNILAKITSSPSLDGEYELYHVAASDRFAFSVYDSAGASDTATANNFGAPAVGTWYFYFVYHDTTNNLIGISINDGTVNTTASTRVTNTSSCNFTIGAIATPTSYFNGRNQFIGAWSRVLTASEVTQLYNRGFGLDYSDLDAGLKTSLISYWELTEASGTRADSHGTNNLTDNNTVTGNPGVVYDAPATGRNKRMTLLGVG